MKIKRRLIDANRFIEWLDVGHLRSPSEICYSENDVKVIIDRQPTIEAEPVVHGEWIIERSPVEAEIKCSECGYSYIDADSYAKAEYNYCPNCGAKMDGGDQK